MTNREVLLEKMTAMSDEDLAEYLEGCVAEDISMLICRKCQKAHEGECPMEMYRLDQCPRGIAGWLKEEA